MDFEDSPEEAKFRSEVRSWLDKNAKKREKRTISAEDMENVAATELESTPLRKAAALLSSMCQCVIRLQRVMTMSL